MNRKQRAALSTLREIAAAVPVPAAVVSKRRKLDGLRDRRDRVSDELAAIAEAVPRGVIAGPLVDAYREATMVRRQVDAEIETARAEYAQERGAYVAAIEAALEPATSTAIAGALEAYGALLRHLAVLDERNEALRPIGGAEAVRKHVTAYQFGLVARAALGAALGKPAVDAVLAHHEPPRRVASPPVESLAAE